jgi:hypothetical protein
MSPTELPNRVVILAAREMTTLSLACHFAGVNDHVTRVPALTPKYKWQPSLATLLESPKIWVALPFFFEVITARETPTVKFY